jgi:Rod binding domain-containing protein
MPGDIGISSAASLAASSWAVGKPSSTSEISQHQTFHQELEAAAAKKDTPEKISGAAKQFEALMIGQMLKSAREASGGGWLGDEEQQDDQTGSMVMELAEQGLSQALTAHGGLGIAKVVTANLERSTSQAAHSHARTPSSGSEALPAPSSKNILTNTDSKR